MDSDAELRIRVMACRECYRRKIKCNRDYPCSHCKKLGIVCQPITATKKVVEPKSDSHAARRRIAQLEAKLESLAKSREEEHADNTKTEVTRPFAEAFWSSMANEVDGLSDAAEEDYPVSRIGFAPIPEPGTSLLFFYPETLTSVQEEPNEAMSRDLCDFYLERFEPLLKILHLPTVHSFVYNGTTYLGYHPDAYCNRALKACMHFAAISAMAQTDRAKRFGKLGDLMFRRLRSAADIALAQADCACSARMPTLQALTIFVISCRIVDSSRRMWTMTALLIRVAYANRLHRELENEAIFERELKRRLWYSCLFLDSYCALDRATEPLVAEGTWTRPLPCNVNDEDFDSTSNDIVSREGEVTEMTYALVLYGLVPAIQRLCTSEKSPGGDTWEERVKYAKSHMALIEQKYLRHCNPSNPFESLILATGQLSQSSMILRAIRPIQQHISSVPPRVGSEWVLQLSVDHLRRVDHISNEKGLAAWPRMPWVPWHAIAVTLAGLCSIKGTYLASQAWSLVERVMRTCEHDVADQSSGMLWRPIQKLYKRAKAFRDGQLQERPEKRSTGSGSENSCISQVQSLEEPNFDACGPPELWSTFPFQNIPTDFDFSPLSDPEWFNWQDAMNEMDLPSIE